MRGKILSKITAVLLAVIMVLGMVPSAVKAAIPTINMDYDEGTITIIKEVPETKNDEHGVPQTTYKKIDDVVFTYAKIGTIAQIEVDTSSPKDGKPDEVVVAYTDVPGTLLTDLGITTPDETVGSKDYYYATTIQSKLTNEKVLAYITANGTEMDPTGKAPHAKGTTMIDELTVGLYLFVETDFPSNITKPCDPFVISIPSNVTANPGTHLPEYKTDSWYYDVTAVPKNEEQEPKIDKNIVIDESDNTTAPEPEEGLSKGEDYQIGDTVKYQIVSDLPATITRLGKYTIGDLLSPGLTFDGDTTVKVWALKEDGTYATLNSPADFSVIDPGTMVFGAGPGKTTFDIDFETDKLEYEKTPGVKVPYKKVVVEYTATLNEEAEIYVDGNPNDVQLQYSRTTTSTDTDLVTKTPTKPPIVYTYKVAVTKKGEGTKNNTDMDGVEFELRDSEGNRIEIAEVTTGVDGVYVISPGSGKYTMKVATEAISVQGLNAGQYQLVETKTKDGYTLLEKPIIINIKSKMVDEEGDLIEPDCNYIPVTYKVDGSGNILSGDYFQVTGGKLYAEVFNIVKNTTEFVALDTTPFKTGDFVKFDGKVYSDTVGTEVQRYDRVKSDNMVEVVESNYDINSDGFITFTVVNKKGFNIPSTGGMGTYLFTIGGIAIMAAAVILLFRRRKTAAAK